MQIPTHPNIQIDTPIEGHYIVTGHNPRSAFHATVGHLAVSPTLHISPEVPDEVLLAIIADRKEVHRPPAAQPDPASKPAAKKAAKKKAAAKKDEGGAE